MAWYKEHCADCLKELGNDWSVVHRWLDELFIMLGEKHRDVRHHRKGIEEVRKKWGDEAARAAEIHISRDFFGFIPEDEMDVQKWMVGVIIYPRNDGNDVDARNDEHVIGEYE